MEKTKNVKKRWSENLKGTGRAADLGVNGRVILKFIFDKQGVNVGNKLNCLRIEYDGELLQNG
jgi:hypothetical protein